eukprot:gene18148-21700_t
MLTDPAVVQDIAKKLNELNEVKITQSMLQQFRVDTPTTTTTTTTPGMQFAQQRIFGFDKSLLFGYDSHLGDAMTAPSTNIAMPSNAELPGHDSFISGQRRRGYVLVKKSSDDDARETFEYVGSEIDMKQAVVLLNDAANLGNHKAMYILGSMEELGETGIINFTKAAEWYQKAADEGNADAQQSLAFLYSTGKGVPMDEARAILYYSFAAAAGNVLAKISLGYRYLHGHGTAKSCQKAARLYEEVAAIVVDDYARRGFGYQSEAYRFSEEQFQKNGGRAEDESVVDFFRYSATLGDASALVTMANLYLQGGLGVAQDFRVAFEYYRDAAAQAYPAGVAGVGFMYSKGYGVAQDNSTAFKYYAKATKLGHYGAQSNLGEMYLNGWGVEQNIAKAHHLFVESADKGDVDAQINLGKMYSNGIHVPKDKNKALQYFMMAAKHGNPTAIYHMAKLNLAHQTAATCQASVQYFKKVAEKGHWSILMTQAHELFDEGDEERSLLFFEKGAEMGIEIAQNNAGWMYDQRLGVPDQLEQEQLDKAAFRHFSHSAEQANAFAHLKMGDYYYYGRGAAASIDLAAESYHEAATLQNSQALFNLGVMHQFGTGRPQDLFLAKRYYDMALQHQPNAYIPVYLALLGLLGHFVYKYVSAFLGGKDFSSLSSAATGAIFDASHSNSDDDDLLNFDHDDDLSDLKYDMMDASSKSGLFAFDTYVILLLLAVFGYLVIRRQRILLARQQPPVVVAQPVQPPAAPVQPPAAPAQ